MLFAGFFVNQDNIPRFLFPFHNISIFKYGFQALFQNEFQDLEIECMTSTNPKEKCDPLGDYKAP
jgi:ABC-type multidrug transport system permease subunit